MDVIYKTTLEKARAINNEYRTAAMNRRYYGCRLSTVKRINLTLELITAIASSGTIAAWSLWRTGTGAYLWAGLAAISAICAVVKPPLGLAKEIERYSELVAGYSVLFYEMKQLVEDVRAADGISDQAWNRYKAARDRIKNLSPKDDAKPWRDLHERCYAEINQQITPDTLWWPSEVRA